MSNTTSGIIITMAVVCLVAAAVPAAMVAINDQNDEEPVSEVTVYLAYGKMSDANKTAFTEAMEKGGEWQNDKESECVYKGFPGTTTQSDAFAEIDKYLETAASDFSLVYKKTSDAKLSDCESPVQFRVASNASVQVKVGYGGLSSQQDKDEFVKAMEGNGWTNDGTNSVVYKDFKGNLTGANVYNLIKDELSSSASKFALIDEPLSTVPLSEMTETLQYTVELSEA